MNEVDPARVVADGVVVGHRYDGLFNRLICYLNTVRIASVLGADAVFLWEDGPAGDNAAHGYEDSFAAILTDPRVVAVHGEVRHAGLDGVTLRASRPAVLPGEDPSQVLGDLRRLIADLTLADGRRLGDTLEPGRFGTALHARQGDSRMIPWLLVKYFPAKGWMRVMRESLAADPDGTVYLASDSADLLNLAVQRWPDRVLTRELIDGPEPSKLRADFADALLLAQASRLIAPHHSAFSVFAALAGGVAPETPEEVLDIAPVVRDLVAAAQDDYARDVGSLVALCDLHGIAAPDIERARQHVRDLPGRARRLARTEDWHPGDGRAVGQGMAAGQQDVMEVLELIRPRACAVPMVRLGGPADGGYVVPDDLEGIAGAASMGIGDDVSFDLDLARRGWHIVQLDHTVDEPPVASGHFTFHPMAWSTHDGPGRLSLAAVTTELDQLAGSSPDLLLKFDVEDAEWDILPTLDASILRRYRIIVCELHGLLRLDQPRRRASAKRALAVLTRDHTTVHLHANNHGRAGWVAGIPLANAVEVTLLRNDRAHFTDDPVPIPGPQDQPNHPGRPDLILTPWGTPPPQSVPR